MLHIVLIVMAALLVFWIASQVAGYAGIFGNGVRVGAKAFFNHLLRKP
jgi:hypothetical protein